MRKVNESQENQQDVELLMKSLTLQGTEQKQIYSDSDDEMCTIKDQNEEKASSAIGTLKQAEIFVKSPKNHGEEGKESQLRRATQLIQFDKLETSKKNQNRIRTNTMEIKKASGRKMKLYQRQLFTEEVEEDETCIASGDDGPKQVRT